MYIVLRSLYYIDCKVLLLYVHYSYNTHTLVADILDRVSAKFCELELEYDCLGGGRIDHKKDEKSILVYGYSMVSEMLRPYNGTCFCYTPTGLW